MFSKLEFLELTYCSFYSTISSVSRRIALLPSLNELAIRSTYFKDYEPLRDLTVELLIVDEQFNEKLKSKGIKLKPIPRVVNALSNNKGPFQKELFYRYFKTKR